MADSHQRSLLKAISWRLAGTTGTVVICWLLTGSVAIAATVGIGELAGKTLLYYLHERLWVCISDFRNPPYVPANEPRLLSLLKSASWRLTGTLVTLFLAFWVTGKPAVALNIGAAELGTKLVLYYLHERAWQALRLPQQATILNKENKGT